jgi:hypothetical protein
MSLWRCSTIRISCRAAGWRRFAALAEQCGLGELLERFMTVRDRAGANASAKASSVIFGMVAGAESIDDLDLLRHGGMRRLFPGGAGALDARGRSCGRPASGTSGSSTRSRVGC